MQRGLGNYILNLSLSTMLTRALYKILVNQYPKTYFITFLKANRYRHGQ